MAEQTREEVDAKLAAAEARTDTKFAELRGDMKALNAKLDTIVSYTAGTKATIIGTGVASVIAVAALIAAMLAYGGQLFGVGMDISTVANEAATRAIEHAAQKP